MHHLLNNSLSLHLTYYQTQSLPENLILQVVKMLFSNFFLKISLQGQCNKKKNFLFLLSANIVL